MAFKIGVGHLLARYIRRERYRLSVSLLASLKAGIRFNYAKSSEPSARLATLEKSIGRQLATGRNGRADAIRPTGRSPQNTSKSSWTTAPPTIVRRRVRGFFVHVGRVA
jgi:hypothetical protein